MKKVLFLKITFLLAVSLLVGCATQSSKEGINNESRTLVHNPVLPGYFADPSVVELDGVYYMYVTSDPWGTNFLACWTSDDFVNWEFHALNWPTKEACTTPFSSDSQVWAPSVIKRGNEYYMYVSVGSEIWCGKASHPLGPWENMLGDDVMIPYDTTKYYHVIDAEVFVDDDDKYYLYWGSGWNWINGHCYVAELADDMCSFKDEPVEVTPANYFEAPLMVKKDGVYYLTYSEGITMDDTYKVRYAVGDNPYGPFTEAENSPVLAARPEKQVYGPGHHTVVELEGELYILYHKHRLPYVEGTAYRQTCMDLMVVNTEKKIIETIEPTDSLYINLPAKEVKQPITLKEIIAGSETISRYEGVKNTQEDNYQTLWRPMPDDATPWIQMTLPEGKNAKSLAIRFEYPWKEYPFDCEVSADGEAWRVIYQNKGEEMAGSPLTISIPNNPRYIRLAFKTPDVAIWRIAVYE
ncbi:MAG: family 43 glycosylhydrolase [Tannerellaceae bacterium]|nr:family 43 glycosylhydrolase [Tannerellaceae bacterium]